MMTPAPACVNAGARAVDVARTGAVDVAVVVYVQLFFVYRDQEQLVNPYFWWVVGVYPFILVLFSLCFTALYQRLSWLSFRESLALEAASQLPLYSFILLSVLLRWYEPVETGVLLTVTLLAMVGMKSMVARMASETRPAGTLPGQRTMPGTR